ncbi:MAG: A24 family peptidase [Rhodocyclaceae bacterium]|nr:A24 family peptidase [Rhodocyclaceae bacterium]
MLKYAAWPAGIALVLAGLLLDLRYGVLTAFLLASVYTDIQSRKIPNRVVYAGIGVAMLCQVGLPSGEGLWVSLQGAGLGLVMFLPLYFLRAMGAGDVKLMAMVGAFVGPQLIIGATLSTLIAGGVMAVMVVLMKHEFWRLIENLKAMLFGSLFKLAAGQLPVPDQPAASVGKLPYALAIATGTLGYLFWNHYITHQ